MIWGMKLNRERTEQLSEDEKVILIWLLRYWNGFLMGHTHIPYMYTSGGDKVALLYGFSKSTYTSLSSSSFEFSFLLRKQMGGVRCFLQALLSFSSSSSFYTQRQRKTLSILFFYSFKSHIGDFYASFCIHTLRIMRSLSVDWRCH